MTQVDSLIYYVGGLCYVVKAAWSITLITKMNILHIQMNIEGAFERHIRFSCPFRF